MGRASNFNFLALVAFATIAVVVACAPKGQDASPSNPRKPVQTNPGSSLSADEKIALSDVLTDEAEDVMQLSTLKEAKDLLLQAVAANESNHRAQMWLHMIAPVEVLKGMHARIRPLYLKQAHGQQRYDRFLKKSLSGANEAARKFAMDLGDPKLEVHTEEQLTDVLAQLASKLNELRLYVKNNKHRDLEMRLPIQSLSMTSKDGCRAAIGPMSIDLGRCDGEKMATIILNRADFEAIQIYASFYMVQAAVMTAYQINPLILVSEESKLVSAKRLFEILFKNQTGTRRANNQWALLGLALEDFIVAERYWIANQAELCSRNDLPANGARTLFGSGLCMRADDDLPRQQRALKIAETISAGEPVTIDQAHMPDYSFKVNAHKILSEPPEDLTPFIPSAYDKLGRATEVDERPYFPYIASNSVTEYLLAFNRDNDELRAAQLLEAEKNIADQVEYERRLSAPQCLSSGMCLDPKTGILYPKDGGSRSEEPQPVQKSKKKTEKKRPAAKARAS